eukprot:COSAG01_NODE_3808_length_5677_cov_7.172643_1_plen_78_part_10
MKEIDDDNSGSIELSELRQWLAVHHTDVTEEGSLAVALRSEVPPPPPPPRPPNPTPHPPPPPPPPPPRRRACHSRSRP